MKLPSTRCFNAFLVSLLWVSASGASPHPYGVSSYRQDPWCDKDKRTFLTATVFGGSTANGKSPTNETIPVLWTYGLQDYSRAFRGVPKPTDLAEDLSLFIDAFDDIDLSDKTATFGMIVSLGKFKFVKVEPCWRQNWTNGFFTECVAPITHMRVYDVEDFDLTNDDEKVAEWQEFFERYDDLLQAYGIKRGAMKQTDVGDLVVQIGYSFVREQCKPLNRFGFTIKGGMSFPTAESRDVSKAFAMPAGYNGHIGFPFQADMNLGIFKWLDLEMHCAMQVFLSNTKQFRMKTHSSQSGFIKFAKGLAKLEMGRVYELGAALQTAKFMRTNFSFRLGYNYETQKDSLLVPLDMTTFSTAIVNTDSRFAKWNKHTMHLELQYQPERDTQKYRPHISFFYNRIVKGKRVFRTNSFGGTVGCQIVYHF